MDYCAMGLESAKEKNDKNYIAKFQYYIGCKLDETNYDKAVEFYEFALQTADDLKDKLLYCRKIAFFYFYRNKLETSLDYFKKCKDIIQSGAHDTYDIDSEIIKIEELLDKNSDLNRMNEHYDIGAQYFNAMNFEDAAKEMEVALSFVPQDLQALDVLNRALYRIKQYDRCFEVAHEGYLISLRDHDYRFLDMFCYNLGNILYNSGKPDEALKYYKCALNIKPYDTDYLYFVGACHRNLGDYVEALRIFNIAHNIDPEDKGIAEQLDFCMNKLKLIESSFPK
jgi:tetratricopeptide (TPR) repeat protein